MPIGSLFFRVTMIQQLKQFIALDNPFRLFYHLFRAVIANVYYRFPAKGMIVIGVTGTNGKTTTSNIIAKWLRESGKKVFMFSTVNVIMWDEEVTNTSKMTSPDVFVLQRLLAQAKKNGCEYAVIETASHGIKMNRTWGIPYDFAVLTNITQDHLDLHRTMKDYVATKLKLFKNLIIAERKDGIKKTAIINIDSDYQELFMAETYDSLYTYGMSFESNLHPQNIKNKKDYTEFLLDIPGGTINVKTPLRWMFNVYNLLAAIGVFVWLGMKPKEIEKIVENIEAVPWRMEEIKSPDGFSIFVDYAHTPDALENVLGTLRDIEGTKRVISVFWATGDRDVTKRPIMGEVVSRLSDVVILTQDDDYSERPEKIIKDILPWIERKQWEDFWIIIDRREAIRTALVMAEPGDIVLIAGKGDEHTIVNNAGTFEWHDKTEVEKILKDIDDNKILK